MGVAACAFYRMGFQQWRAVRIVVIVTTKYAPAGDAVADMQHTLRHTLVQHVARCHLRKAGRMNRGLSAGVAVP